MGSGVEAQHGILVCFSPLTGLNITDVGITNGRLDNTYMKPWPKQAWEIFLPPQLKEWQEHPDAWGTTYDISFLTW